MVSLDEFISLSFAKQLNELRECCRAQLAWPSPETGFALGVLQDAGESGWYELPSAATISHALRHPQELAAVGFLLAMAVESRTEIAPDWERSLDELLKRDAFPPDRQTFVFRPLEFLGICQGAATILPEAAPGRVGLQRLLDRLANEGNSDPWSRALYELSAFLLHHDWNRQVSPVIEECGVDLLALFKWIARSWPESSTGLRARRDGDAIDLALLQRCATELYEPPDAARAALLLSALKRTLSERIQSNCGASWLPNRELRDAVALVTELCRRFPLFARQLQHRRCDLHVPGQKEKAARPTVQMTDEYDVQDTMHALLKLFFDDVRPEVWAPSYGASQTRMDFVLSQEHVVVETKMTRKGLDQKKVVEQLIVDKEHYRRDSNCRTLVCFVYDPECRCDNPSALEDDLSNRDEEFEMIVVVAPKGM